MMEPLGTVLLHNGFCDLFEDIKCFLENSFESDYVVRTAKPVTSPMLFVGNPDTVIQVDIEEIHMTKETIDVRDGTLFSVAVLADGRQVAACRWIDHLDRSIFNALEPTREALLKLGFDITWHPEDKGLIEVAINPPPLSICGPNPIQFKLFKYGRHPLQYLDVYVLPDLLAPSAIGYLPKMILGLVKAKRFDAILINH